MTFKEIAVKTAVDKLVAGEDHRTAVIDFIDLRFVELSTQFLDNIFELKKNNPSNDLSWYKEHFLDPKLYNADEMAIFGNTNKKTIANIEKSSTKDVVKVFSNDRIDFLVTSVNELKDNLPITANLVLEKNNTKLELNLNETILVFNVIATMKNAIRGGAWSSIGKRVEKPLLDRLCKMAKVDTKYIDNSIFTKDDNLDYDREVDYKLISKTGEIYRIEVKLMGKGNPESADATIARASDIFVADTLSDQNKKQLKSLNVEYLELKNNKNILNDFKTILLKLDIPFDK